MAFHVNFIHLDPSEALETYAKDKLTHSVEKYWGSPIEARVTFEVARYGNKVQARIVTAHGHVMQASEEGEDMYRCVDRLTEKMDSLARKEKERKASHRDADKRKWEARKEAQFEAAPVGATDGDDAYPSDLFS